MNDYLLLGVIVKPQGLNGEVKLRHETGDASRFLAPGQRDACGKATRFAPVARAFGARCPAQDVYLTLEGVETATRPKSCAARSCTWTAQTPARFQRARCSSPI